MSIWDDWLQEQRKRSPVEQMQVKHGKAPDGRSCKTCLFLEYNHHRMAGGGGFYTTHKCLKWHGPAEAWKPYFAGCGLWRRAKE